MFSYLLILLSFITNYARHLLRPIWVKKGDYKMAFVESFLSLFVFSYVSAEVLSLLNYFNQTGIAYTTILFILFQFYFIFNSELKIPKWSFRLDFFDYLVISILLFLLFLAVYVPPNNWDSLSYHLAKIEHWRQNNNIYPFPTIDLRQTCYSPLAEYLIAHWQIFTNNDYLNNLVELFATISCIFLLIELMQILQISSVFQKFAILFFLSHPLIIFESTSTQNDIIAVYFFALFCYFFLKTHQLGYQNFKFFIAIALIVSLSGMLKYSIWVFELPILLFVGFKLLQHNNIKKIVTILAFSTILFALIMGPFWLRNYLHFHSILGDPVMSKELGNEVKNFETLFSNGLKNIADYCFTPNPFINRQIESVIVGLHKIVDIPLNDAKRNFLHFTFQPTYYFSEDNASSIAHFLPFFFAALAAIFVKKPSSFLHYLLLVICIDFSLYSIIFRWQIFGIRLQLPVFFLVSLWLAYFFENIFKQSKKVQFTFYIINFIFFVLALPPLLFNKNKPVLPIAYLRNMVGKPDGYLTKDETINWTTYDFKMMENYYIRLNDGSLAIRPDLSSLQLNECFNIQNKLQKNYKKSIFENTRLENYFILDPSSKNVLDSTYPKNINVSYPKVFSSQFEKSWEYLYFIYLKKNFGSNFYLGNKLETSTYFKQNFPEKSFYNVIWSKNQ